ncbi:MAG: PKD domain-containing protein, partial [Bacteroidetes bacterium]|nr:PKD domain-containing protein [Bacteroidota bacterium]
NGSYQIPVVFHVFGTEFNGGTTVTYETVVQALKTTNEDWQGNNKYDGFRHYQENDYGIEFSYQFMPNIEFILANKDPEGNYTTGVEFFEEKSGFGNGSGADSEIRKYAWDNKRYLNVYIMRDLYADKKYTNSGVSWYPNTQMTNSNTSRVVYNGSYLDGNMNPTPEKGTPEWDKMVSGLTGNSPYGYLNENFRSVFSHELGHWLDLMHPFETDSCVPRGYEGKTELELGDCVEDTPMVAHSLWTKTDKNCRGEITNWQNFMNYTDQYANFTPGQMARIVAALEDRKHTARKSIWTNAHNVLLPNGKAGIAIPNSRFLETPSTNDGSFDSKLTLTIIGKTIKIKGDEDDDITSSMSVSNLPSGLTMKLKKISYNTIELSVKGKISAHEKTNSTKATVRFYSNMLENYGITFENDSYEFDIDCIDKYDYIVEDIDYKLTNGNGSFSYDFPKDYTVPSLSIKLVNNALIIDGMEYVEKGDANFGCYVMCNGITRNIKLSYSGETIDSKKYMRRISSSAKPLINAKGIYEDWRGKEAYISFAIPSRDNSVVFGWIKLNVDASGKSAVIKSIGYNSAPNKSVIVGQDKDGNIETSVNFSSDKQYIKKDGSIQFTALAFPIEKISSYSWSFPGGTPATSNKANPKVKYKKEGSYDVQLTVDGGLIKKASDYIIVRKEIKEDEDPEKPKQDDGITTEAIAETIVTIGDNPTILENIPNETLVIITKNGTIIKEVKVNEGNSLKVENLTRGTYVYTYTLNGTLITRGKIEVIK